MKDSESIGMFAERALTYVAAEWETRGAPAELAVDVLAIAGVSAILGDSPAAYEFAEKVIAAIPTPRYIDAPLFAALAAAATALKVSDSEYAAEYIGLLAEHADAGASDANTALLRLALHGAALRAYPRVRLDLSPALLRNGRSEDLLSVVKTIEAASAYGTIPLAVPEPLCAIIQGAALSKFRAYDLSVGMRVARAARYLTDDSSAEILACNAFIRSSQERDGGFGDYHMAFQSLKRSGQGHAIWTIRSAITLDALWTIAELTSADFRMARALFGNFGLARRTETSGKVTC